MFTKNNLNWRTFLLLSLIVMMAVLMAACGSTPTPAPQAQEEAATPAPQTEEEAPAEEAVEEPAAESGEQVTLSVWHVDETELEPIIAAYKAKNPNIDIDFSFFPWGPFFEKLDASYAAGDPPDVHRQDDDEIPFFAQRGVLLPLDDYLAGQLNPDELYWDTVKSTEIDGHLWVSVPAIRVGHFWYNKTLFEAAGVPLPPSSYEEAWTWAEFVETARALTDASKQQYGAGGINSADFVTAMGRSQGAEILSDDCTEFLLDDPVMVDMMQQIADLMQVEGIVADPETLEAFGGPAEMFNAGQLAMRYGDTRDVPAEDVGFEYDVAPLPVFPGHDPVIFAAIENYGVANSTEHPEEAAAFAAYLMSEEAQTILAETKNVIPINKKAATEVWVNQSPVNRQLLVEAAQYGRTNPMAVGFGRAQEIAWPAIQEVMLGQKTAEDAMNEVKPLVDAELQKIGGCLGQ